MRPRIKKSSSEKIFTTAPINDIEEEVLQYRRFLASNKPKPKQKYYFLFGVKKVVTPNIEQHLIDGGFNIIEE